MDNRAFIGVDVGGTKTAVALCSGDRVLQHAQEATPVSDLNGLLDLVTALAAPWLEQAAGIGVCTPGWHDPRTGRISLAGNIPALTGADLRSLLQERLRLPVTVGNDADAAALAEFRLGAARGWDSLFFVTVSTGVGGGFVNGSGILTGHSGTAAEIGHLQVVPGGLRCACGASGCLEAHASGTAIARLASERSGRQLTARQVFALWHEGDAVATETVSSAAAALGAALHSVTQLLDPQGIVLGGGVVAGNPQLASLIHSELAARLSGRPVPVVVTAGLGGDAGVLGAALLAQAAA